MKGQKYHLIHPTSDGKRKGNMFFYMPTKVYSETDCVKNHGKELCSLGTKALIVTGRHSSRQNGSLEDVQEALEDYGIPYDVFDRIVENPSVELVMEAREFGLETGADFVIGVGGGSSIDAAKAISLMMKHREEGASYLYGKELGDAYPVAAVPTTCGTGSEVTPYSILTVHEKHTKSGITHRIFPVYALVDGKYLKTAPKSVLHATAVDALGHFIESRVNTNATDYSIMLCREGLRLWTRCKDVLKGEMQADEAVFADMMNASSIAGMAISHTGTSLPHGLSYYLTYECGVAHGRAVGIFLPGYLEAADEDVRKEILEILGMNSIEEFRDFVFTVLELPEIPGDLKERAVKGMLSNQRKLANCPFEVNRQVLEHIIP